MFLLLPFLLLTTSAQKLVGLHMQVQASAGGVTPQTGEVEHIAVVMTPTALSIRARLKRTDVRASAEELEEREIPIPATDDGLNLLGLQEKLRSLKALSPLQQKIALQPQDDVLAHQLVVVMDAVRSDNQGDLFPQVVLGQAP
ncbi:MAG: hypothetical protein VX519_08325 [Myxococcota bacterium]|nr:hypothetical protein [Myxococcota bacterium]